MGFFEGNRPGANAWRAACALAAGTAFCSGAAGQATQSGIVPEPPTASYSVLEHRAADMISTDDAAVIRAKQHEITMEAAMFGYDLNHARWSYDETECPAIPNALLLHYRTAAAANGAQSLFTAIVPRGPGRVLVNPVLYHGATPFEAAIGQKRTMSVFNQAVPAEVAKQDVQPEGHWLTLAICYAEIAGSEPRVPEHPELEPPLVKAPPPTIWLSEAKGATEIQFTGRDAPNDYTVWKIGVNHEGRVVEADSITYPNFTGGAEVAQADPKQRTVSPQSEKSGKVKEPSDPKVKVLPDLPDPAQKTLPQ
jgi:hypothetical protein